MVTEVPSVRDLHKACQAASLAALCLPHPLDDASARPLTALARERRHVARGELLYHQGDDLRALYVIVDGLIKTYITAASGREQITGFHFPQELIGLDGFSSRIHVCSAAMLRAGEVQVVPFARLNMPGPDARLPRLLLRLASKQLAEQEELLFLLGARNAHQRMAGFLLSLCFRLGSIERLATRYCLSMSRQEIGNYLGLTKETICRLLARLQDESIIGVQRKQVEIRDLLGLSCAAGLDRGPIPARRQAIG